jgi:hypothetical protein
MTTLTTITATFFSVSILFTYLVVRTRRVSIPSALIVGFMINSLAFFLFAIARDDGFMQSLSIGFLQGLIFTITAVVMGGFFRQHKNNENYNLEYALENSDSKA